MQLEELKIAVLKYEASLWSISRLTRKVPNPDMARLRDFYNILLKRYAYDTSHELTVDEEAQLETLIVRRERWQEKSGNAFAALYEKMMEFRGHQEDRNDEKMNGVRQRDNDDACTRLATELANFKNASETDYATLMENKSFAYFFELIIDRLKAVEGDSYYHYANFMKVVATKCHADNVLRAMILLDKQQLLLPHIDYLLDNPAAAMDLALLIMQLSEYELLSTTNIKQLVGMGEHLPAAVWYVKHGFSDSPDDYQACFDLLIKHITFFDDREVMCAFREAVKDNSDGFDLCAFQDVFTDNATQPFEICRQALITCVKQEASPAVSLRFVS